MSSLFGIYGANGCGRGIMPLARQLIGDEISKKLVFVDDAMSGAKVNGHEVLGFDEFVAHEAEVKKIVVAVANTATRINLVRRCEEAQLEFFNVLAESSIVMDNVTIGTGTLISPFVVLTSNIHVGRHFHANINSYVEHDCVIGDFVTFAPGVRCNGNVHIEEGAYIGCGAVIKQGTPEQPLRIGRGAVVGMGSVVTKDVPENMTVVGNPARPFAK